MACCWTSWSGLLPWLRSGSLSLRSRSLTGAAGLIGSLSCDSCVRIAIGCTVRTLRIPGTVVCSTICIVPVWSVGASTFDFQQAISSLTSLRVIINDVVSCLLLVESCLLLIRRDRVCLWDHEIGRRRKGVTFVCGEGNENKEFEGHGCLCVVLNQISRPAFILSRPAQISLAGSFLCVPKSLFVHRCFHVIYQGYIIM